MPAAVRRRLRAPLGVLRRFHSKRVCARRACVLGVRTKPTLRRSPASSKLGSSELAPRPPSRGRVHPMRCLWGVRSSAHRGPWGLRCARRLRRDPQRRRDGRPKSRSRRPKTRGRSRSRRPKRRGRSRRPKRRGRSRTRSRSRTRRPKSRSRSRSQRPKSRRRAPSRRRNRARSRPRSRSRKPRPTQGPICVRAPEA